jgi:bifunctional non-homologous end joining protein LigD
MTDEPPSPPAEEQQLPAADSSGSAASGKKRKNDGGDGQEREAAKTRKRSPAAEKEYTMIEVAGRELRVSSPSKLYFPEARLTKLDLVDYYIACHEAVLVHLRERPTVMKRWVDGVQGKPFFQKRVPDHAPEWLQTAVVKFPSGRSARELVADDAAHLIWGVNLGVIDWNPWPVRRADLDHPDELRVDLDPEPGVPFAQVRDVALAVREVLEQHHLRGFPKTSGSRGIHVFVRIAPTHTFHEVRRAALALAREVERHLPSQATTRWWKEQREGVFIDYNQNARDRTVASAYSVRAVADARVSCPLEWDEVPDAEPSELRLDTVPTRLRLRGDPAAEIDRHPGSLDSLLELADRDEREGLGDAPWPPHFRKQRGEPRRVQPSRARNPDADSPPDDEGGDTAAHPNATTARRERKRPSAARAQPPTKRDE